MKTIPAPWSADMRSIFDELADLNRRDAELIQRIDELVIEIRAISPNLAHMFIAECKRVTEGHEPRFFL